MPAAADLAGRLAGRSGSGGGSSAVGVGASARAAATAPASGTPAARGAFIVLEGVDRCGKSTQCARLVDALTAEGHPAELWRFPDRTTDTGRMIDAYLGRKADLDDGAVHLLFSANRWEKRAGLVAALAGGATVVADRYAFSGVAFTAAKGVPGLDAAWAAAPDAGLPAPDVVLYLDLPPAAAAARGGFGEERYEEPALLAAVRAQFEGMRSRRAGGCEWVAIDASPSIEDVSAAVRAAVSPALERAAAGAPVRALWDGGPLAG